MLKNATGSLTFIFTTLSMFIIGTAFAQTNYGGFFPETGLTKSLSKKFSFKLKIESQHGLLQVIPDESDHFDYFHDRTDFQGFVGYQIENGSKLAVGYQYRLQPGIDNHRSIQQISWSDSRKLMKLSHRIRADQTFETRQPDLWRLRYRFKYQRGFSGGTNYLMISNEIIYGYQLMISSWENRLVMAIGINLPDGSRLQVGPDYRVDADFGSSSRTRIWLKIGWFRSF